MGKAATKNSNPSRITITELVYRSPGDLRPWPSNARQHSDRQLIALKANIKKFGFTTPILVDEAGVILNGHGRCQAAMELGLPNIPTRVIEGLTETEKRACVLADNKLSDLSAWDNDQLKAELELLIHADFELETTGFSTAEIDLMFDASGEPEKNDPDDLQADDIPKAVVSQPGDLWCLGEHRLLCGDALEADSYNAVMQEERAQMVISDPPYNVRIHGHVCGSGNVKHREFGMASGEMSSQEFTEFLKRAMAHLRTYSRDGAIQFFFIDWRHIRELEDAALPVFGAPRQLCVWTKDNAGLGSFYRSQHELVFVFKKGDAPHINNFELGQHGRYRTNVWSYPGVNTFKGKGRELLSLHPTVKPVALVADAMRDCSHRGGIVLDPFSGSGTALIAAERTGRRARVIERDPQYVDVAVLRWQRVTGQHAVLDATGQMWDDVREERLTKASARTA
jgi:DNA modification methylase